MIFDEFVAVFFVIVVQLGLKDGIGFTTGHHTPGLRLAEQERHLCYRGFKHWGSTVRVQ